MCTDVCGNADVWVTSPAGTKVKCPGKWNMIVFLKSNWKKHRYLSGVKTQREITCLWCRTVHSIAFWSMRQMSVQKSRCFIHRLTLVKYWFWNIKKGKHLLIMDMNTPPSTLYLNALKHVTQSSPCSRAHAVHRHRHTHFSGHRRGRRRNVWPVLFKQVENWLYYRWEQG